MIGITIDGQTSAKSEPAHLELLDAVGIARRQSPAPLVIETTIEEFVEAGGWPATIQDEDE